MRTHEKTLLVFLIILILYFITNSLKKKSVETESVAPVEVENISNDDLENKESKKEIAKEITEQPNNLIVQSIPDISNSLSYMDVFHDYLLAKTCDFISNKIYNFYDLKQDVKEPEQILLDSYDYDNFQVSSSQIKTWNILFNDCLDLFQYYSDFLDSDFAISDEYYDSFNIEKSLSDELWRLLAVKKNAKTEKEKSLKNVIVQISKYQEMKRNYSKENFIKYSISDEEVADIQRRVRDLSAEYNATPEHQQAERTAIVNEFDKLQKYLERNSVPDKKSYQAHKNKFMLLHYQLLNLLPRTSGYEFQLIIEAMTDGLGALSSIYRDSHGNKYEEYVGFQDINLNVYQKNEIKDYEYYDLLINPVFDLFYCYKGVDCSAESLVIKNYCLGFNHPQPYPSACNKDLDTFYFDSYLSANQTMDAKKIFEYLVSHYDK